MNKIGNFEYRDFGEFRDGLAIVLSNDRSHNENWYAWTHHIKPDGSPAYSERYDKVSDFSERRALVSIDGVTFHITTDGSPAYARRYPDTSFGISLGHFKFGRASVRSSNGCYHITPDGESAYPERYRDVGDFKDGLAVVKDPVSRRAFYIHPDGKRAHKTDFHIATDFKNGSARIIRRRNGWPFTIDRNGFIRESRWLQLMDILRLTPDPYKALSKRTHDF